MIGGMYVVFMLLYTVVREVWRKGVRAFTSMRAHMH